MEFTEIIQQFGIGLGGSVVVSIVLYRVLAARIVLLENLVRRHQRRESAYIKCIERLISIPRVNKSHQQRQDEVLKDYHNEIKSIDSKD